MQKKKEKRKKKKEKRKKKKEKRKKKNEILRINILPYHHQQEQCLVGYLGCFQEVSLLHLIPYRGR
jgi:hypothetical protein